MINSEIKVVQAKLKDCKPEDVKGKAGLEEEVKKLNELIATHSRLVKMSALQYRIVMKVGGEKIVLYATDKSHPPNPE